MIKKVNHLVVLLGFSLIFTLVATASLAIELSDTSEIDEYLYEEEPKTISMDFKNAQLNDVLKIFSQQSGLNFIAATAVSNRTINLYLDNVPVEEALERILSANGLTYEIKPGSNIFVVKPLDRPDKELITRVYKLQHATVPSSLLNSTITISDDDESGSGDSGSTSSGVTEAVTAVLSAAGSIVEDARTNSIIVTDVPSQFPIIESTLARLDVRVPQVLIEVEMLDISKSTADLIGAKFGSTPISFTGAQRQDLIPFTTDEVLDKGKASFSTGLGADGRYTASTVSFAGLTMTLQFLRTQTDTKNLARPRILTLNNQTAEIEIKTDEVIGETTETSEVGGAAQSSSAAERTETGVFLRVTPQANLKTSEITMAIEPRVVQARRSTFSGDKFRDPEERGSKSILRVRDGDTIILGGLLRDDVQGTRTKLPVLGEIPLIGGVFRHKDFAVSERELIIFITPHIVREDLASVVSTLNQREFVREQDVPSKRLDAVNQDLSLIENRRL